MSSPPISETNRTSGCWRSTQAATATTSWISLAPTSRAMKPAPAPGTKTRAAPNAAPRLYRGRPDRGREYARPGAGEEDAVRAGRQAGLGFHAREELLDLLGLAGIVPMVALPAHLAVLHHHRLDGGGADIDADQLHDFPIRLATCRTSFAAVPAVV